MFECCNECSCAPKGSSGYSRNIHEQGGLGSKEGTTPDSVKKKPFLSFFFSSFSIWWTSTKFVWLKLILPGSSRGAA